MATDPSDKKTIDMEKWLEKKAADNLTKPQVEAQTIDPSGPGFLGDLPSDPPWWIDEPTPPPTDADAPPDEDEPTGDDLDAEKMPVQPPDPLEPDIPF